MPENRWSSQNFLFGTLQNVGGSVLIVLAVAIWAKVKHGSVDWFGIGALFLFAFAVFFLLFRLVRRYSQLLKGKGGEPESGSASRLKILWAHYGADGGPVKEVAEEYLKPRIRGDSLVGWVGSDLFGPLDPAIGLNKQLKVRYSFDGAESTVTRPQHALLVLPEDTYLREQLEACQRAKQESRSNFEELKAELARLKRAQFSIAVNGVPIAGPAKAAAQDRMEEAAQQPLGTLFSPLQVMALELRNDLGKFLEEIGPEPVVQSSNFANTQQGVIDYIETKEATVSRWRDVLREKYESRFRERARELYHRFSSVGARNRSLGSLADSATSIEDIQHLMQTLWTMCEVARHETAGIP